jgi:hypothetical protein
MITFVTFGTAEFAKAKSTLLSDARKCGYFTRVVGYAPEDLEKTPEFQTLTDVIRNTKRGWGYWWWKPYIIRREMELVGHDDLVFYSDAGRYYGGQRIDDYVRFILEKYKHTGFTGVEVPYYGPNQIWTKPECFEVLGCDLEEFRSCPQIQPTFVMWKKNAANMRHLAEWEYWCREPRAVADPEPGSPISNPLYRAHRHDQSIITLLTRKHKLPYISLVSQRETEILRKIRLHFHVVPSFKTIGFIGRAIKRRGIWLTFGEIWLKRQYRRYFLRRGIFDPDP